MYLNLSEFLNVVTSFFGLLGMKIITFINEHMFICVYTCKHSCVLLDKSSSNSYLLWFRVLGQTVQRREESDS